MRSLTGLPLINIRPITILVGRNSAGKSTFLRTFPLIKQSIEARASAPILWFDRNSVDYGDFQTAVRNNNPEDSILFSFEAQDVEVRNERWQRHYYFMDEPYGRRTRTRILSAKLDFEIGLQVQRTSKLRVNFDLPEHEIFTNIVVAKDGRRCEDVIVNGISAASMLPKTNFSFLSSALFAPLRMTQEVKSEKTRQLPYWTEEPLISDIFSLLKPHVDKRIADHNLMLEALKILQSPRLSDDVVRNLIERTELRSVQKLYRKWLESDDQRERKEIDWICALSYAVSNYTNVCHALQGAYGSTLYIGPARASGERFYRNQELEVSEIAPDGENLPMFLASLSHSELSEFSDWVEGIFGYGISVTRNVGHVSITLKRDGFHANVADTGYGVSQVLPILAQTWWANRVRGRGPSGRLPSNQSTFRIFAMEQPELHLHPAHQAKLADVFVEAYAQSKRPIHYVIETHSESLINRLGELIEDGKIPSSAVQIVIFSDDGNGTDPNGAGISISNFDEQGHLKSWPYGFFSY
nr:AAA family ATPase [Ruegeria arenilitoris]